MAPLRNLRKYLNRGWRTGFPHGSNFAGFQWKIYELNLQTVNDFKSPGSGRRIFPARLLRIIIHSLFRIVMILNRQTNPLIRFRSSRHNMG